ncbi:hypothetical protein [uncultured Dysosmobacter sp.]|uniref:hypothetical protein n=1 Tax=uncultured Dysosmobacter sp. TaxID=2591384 RepID=UPI002670ECC2|nr:hypothetical protein [uncultured Dysosmobacter sp.]
MKNKYCPLLSAAEGDSLVTCQGELCAWYVPPSAMGMRAAVLCRLCLIWRRG